jgi:hypothetical protein
MSLRRVGLNQFLRFTAIMEDLLHFNAKITYSSIPVSEEIYIVDRISSVKQRKLDPNLDFRIRLIIALSIYDIEVI